MTGLSSNALGWLGTVLSERFGIVISLSTDANKDVVLRCDGGEGDIRFDVTDSRFDGDGRSLPITWWDARSADLEPMLDAPLPLIGAHGDGPLVSRTTEGQVRMHHDLPGLLRWCLARVEEVGRTDLDAYGRFPSTASHAGRHGYLDRPFLDEWLHLLGQLIQWTWPRVALRSPTFRMSLSHDVDLPSRYILRPFRGFARAVLDDMLSGRPTWALRGAVDRLRGKGDIPSHDPANTFDWLMDRSEGAGVTSAFYFICGRTDARMDAGYEIAQPAMRALMRRIHDRGHEIGLHPSYGTYRNATALVDEAIRLREVCAAEGIQQDSWGGRMHYLRWETPTTLLAWERARMSYDGTLGYADRAGFRCGTCHDYPAFDPVGDRAVELRLRPLVAMEGSVMNARYMGLGAGHEAFEALHVLKDRCRRAGGVFSLLWHNSALTGERERLLYESVLAS